MGQRQPATGSTGLEYHRESESAISVVVVLPQNKTEKTGPLSF